MLTGKYLKKYYKKYAIPMIFGIVVLMLVDIGNMFIPDLIGKLVALFEDGYNPANIFDEVKKLGLYVLALSFAIAIGRVIFRLSLFKASTSIGEGLRNELFEKATRLDQAYYHTTKVGNIMSWIVNDCEEIQEYFGWGTVMLIDGVFDYSIAVKIT